MINVLFLVICCLLLIWTLCRVAAWAIIWCVKRFSGMRIKIGNVGLLTFSNIHVHLWPGITLEIEKVWLSSCYCSRDVRKPLCVYFGPVRVEVQLENGYRGPGPPRPANRPGKTKRTRTWLFSILQHVGVYVDDLNIIALRGVLRDGLIHASLQELSMSPAKLQNYFKMHLSMKTCSAKVLRSISLDAVRQIQPCLAEVSFTHSIHISLLLPNLNIQGVEVSLAAPRASLTEGFIGWVQDLLPSQGAVPEFAETHSSSQTNTVSPPRSWHLLPKILKVDVTDCDITLQKEGTQRKLRLQVQTLQGSMEIQAEKNKPIREALANVQIKGASLTSPQANLGSLLTLTATGQLDPERVRVWTQVVSGFLGYHFEEVQYWMTSLINHASTTPSFQLHPPTPTVPSCNRNTLLDAAGTRSIYLKLELDSVSAAVAMVSCNGIKTGLGSAEVAYERSNLPQDGKLKMELSKVYCKLADRGVRARELSAKQHHWDTLFYLDLLSLKGNVFSSEVSADVIMDSCQCELSTASVAVMRQMLVTILRPRGGSPERCLPARPPTTHNSFKSSSLVNVQLNVQCTNINLFLCHQLKVCTMCRMDELSGQYRRSDLSVVCRGTKLVYMPQTHKSQPLLRSHDLVNIMGHLQCAEMTWKAQNQVLDVRLPDEVSFVWTTALHTCLYYVICDLLDLRKALPVGLAVKDRQGDSGRSTLPNVKVSFDTTTTLGLQLSRGHRIYAKIPSLSADYRKDVLNVKTPQLIITCDHHDIFKIQDVEVQRVEHCPRLRLERESLGPMQLATNIAYTVTFDKFAVTFPYDCNFASCFQELINLNKWRKIVHHYVKPAFTVQSPLPPDLVIKAKTVIVQLCDDPFEVKLYDNYELIQDEQEEKDKRHSAMEKRIQDLRKQHGLLPPSKIDQLFSSLSKKSAEVYMQRSRQLYITTPMRTKLFTWSLENVEVVALADTSLHGTENAVRHMRDIDPDSPYPDGLEFTTLWCRMVNVSTASFVIQLRDYPQNAFDIRDLHVWGRLVGAEQIAEPRARRTRVVEVSQPWKDVVVERNMPSLKFYHDFSAEVSSFIMSYGACWEPTVAQFNHSMNLVNQPSVDPSRRLTFWDRVRLLLHGRLTMSVTTMTWLYHASLDPYNRTEFMDWTWTDLIMDWTNAKWVFRGDLDIYAKTASKYDDCRLLHLPNLRFCVRLEWLCAGDPNDHHSVMPCAPDKLPNYTKQEVHDTYHAFRSKNFTMDLSFETKPREVDNAGSKHTSDQPSCLFYASTLRWMDKIKMCLAKVSRPIRRGRHFHTMTLRRPQLSRHFKNVRFSFNVHKFNSCYWVSFAKQNGIDIQGESLSLAAGMQLRLVAWDDNLSRRPRADWSVTDFSYSLGHTTVWLCSNQTTKGDIPVCGPVKRSFFISVERASYQRADESVDQQADQSQNECLQEEPSRHKVKIVSLKGAWSPDNRNVAFGLFDGYAKAQALKKNLSSEALKGFKVESAQTPNKANKSLTLNSPNTLSSGAATPSPLSKLQSGPAYSMLQRLVAETDSKFVAVHEELSSGGVQVDQLPGIAASQTDDVIRRNWHIELYNSQVMVRGCETAGYVIVSATKASILSCDHKPIWKDDQLRGKRTWAGSIECMQYYATVNVIADLGMDNIHWLGKEDIEDRRELDSGLKVFSEMMGSGQSVGGLVGDVQDCSSSTQLQRIISRCRCQFFYASYGEVEGETLTELPQPGSSRATPPPYPGVHDSDAVRRQKEEAVDSFTLLHHDLNVCTNSAQYAMILDIVNNLLLYVEPKKKELIEKLQNMRFKLHLSRIEDQKTPILQRQNNLRLLVARVKSLQKQLYLVYKAQEDDQENTDLREQIASLLQILQECKEDINATSEELAIMVSCFKESQLLKEQRKSTRSKKVATVSRRNDVCFKHAQWRMTEVDGQIGIADLVLRNFLYSKVNKEDDSGSHQLELGWVTVTNLLPNCLYKDVLAPQEPLGTAFPERQLMLRILCKFKAPVGGISIKEHFEVDVVPLTIQLTHRFQTATMAFFFPDKAVDSDEEGVKSEVIDLMENEPSASSPASDEEDEGDRLGSLRPQRKREERKKEKERTRIGRRKVYSLDRNDIDKMKERSKNNMFLYMKIPAVPLRFSYKGPKEKNMTDVHDFRFLLPTLEYHNQTWTWHDLLMAMKNDSRKVLISQAVKQKLHIRPRAMLAEMMGTEVHEEDDKAQMLLGFKPMAGNEKPSSKRSLFSKSTK